jgi:Uma2 family endonuclease
MSTTRSSPAVTRLTAIPYDVYVQIRDAPGNRGYRMAYHDGVLEIMSPEFRHEKGGHRLGVLVFAYCAAFEVACEPAGATTFRKGLPGQRKGKGKEPDESYYIGPEAVAAVRHKETLDLTVDPPPSLWIEVDNRASSQAKLPLYAALGVPEVWRYRPRARRLWFGQLAGRSYEALEGSVTLPGLTPPLVLDLLAEAESRDGSAWDRWLREVWFPSHRQELIDQGAGR